MSTPAPLVVRDPGNISFLGPASIEKLPGELLLVILAHADDKQLLTCAAVCRRWYWLAQTLFQHRLNPSMQNRLGAEVLYRLDKKQMAERLLTRKGNLATVPSVTFFSAQKFKPNQWAIVGEGYIPKALAGNIAWLHRILAKAPAVFLRIAPELRSNRLLARRVLESEGLYFQHIGDNLKQDRELALLAVQSDGDALEQMPQFRDDEEIVTNALLSKKGDMSPLKFASPRLRDTFDIAKVACTHFPFSFQFIGPELKADTQHYQHLLNLALEGNGLVLKLVPEYRCSPQLYLKAVTSNGLALFCVPADKQTREIVMAAVSDDGTALTYAAEDFQNDPEICQVAVDSAGEALEFVPEDLCTKPLALSALAQTIEALDFIPEALFNDRDIALSAVALSGGCFVEFNQQLRSDLEVCLTAIGQCLTPTSEEPFDDEGFGHIMETMDESLRNLMVATGHISFFMHNQRPCLHHYQIRECCQTLLHALQQGDLNAVSRFQAFLPAGMQPQAAMLAP